mgnify:CR=1 FL=1
MIKKMTTLATAFLMMAILCVSAFAANQAYPWVQSKTNWCWATVAKAMIDTREGGGYSAPSTYTAFNDQTGIRQNYCLYSGGIYLVDKTQEYIVRTYKNDDFTGSDKDNLAGSVTEFQNAVEEETGYDVSNYGSWNTTPFSNITNRETYIDDNLVTNSKEICGNAYSHGSTKKKSKGHSLLITRKLSSGSYKIWNPWNNTYVNYTPDKIFTNGFKPAPFTGTTMYIENVVYFS